MLEAKRMAQNADLAYSGHKFMSKKSTYHLELQRLCDEIMTLLFKNIGLT